MPQFEVVHKRSLFTYVKIEAEDHDEAIEKSYEEGLPDLCGNCINAWGNSWQPMQEVSEGDDSAIAVYDDQGKEIWSAGKK